MKHTITIGLMSLVVFAQAQASEKTPQLKDALKRFPGIDANRDGVLTLSAGEFTLVGEGGMSVTLKEK